MSEKYLGLPFDIHGGGADLAFPHHENERAQSEAACGCTFANYWMHGGMLQINSEKMSKSLGNFMLLHDVLETTRPEALRMLMLQTHYRSPLDFSDDRLAEADAALSRIENAVRSLDWQIANAADGDAVVDAAALSARADATRTAFVEAMDDDFNAAEALGAIFSLVGEANAAVADRAIAEADIAAVSRARDEIVELMGVLGIDVEKKDEEAGEAYPVEVVDLAAEVAGYAGGNPAEAVEALLAARADARAAKDWGRADAVRDGLAALGLKVVDTPQGQRVERA